jgi:hypothetical protein
MPNVEQLGIHYFFLFLKGQWLDIYSLYFGEAFRSFRLSSRSGFPTLQRTNTENVKQIFPEKELRGHSPNFNIHVPVSDLHIPTIDLPILLQEICGPILGIHKSLTDT